MLILMYFQIIPNLNVMREVDESILDDQRSGDRDDDPEYVRTVVVCDAGDQFMQNVSIFLFFILKNSLSVL